MLKRNIKIRNYSRLISHQQQEGFVNTGWIEIQESQPRYSSMPKKIIHKKAKSHTTLEVIAESSKILGNE